MFDELDLNQFFSELLVTIDDRLKYNKFYFAEVKLNADPVENRGGVFVECLDLNAINPISYIRADVIQSSRAGVYPAVGDTGYLFFVNANPDQAKFLPGEGALFEGNPLQTKHILVKSPTVESFLQVDEVAGFIMESKSPAGAVAAVEPMVLGDKLVKILDNVMTFFETIVGDLDSIYGLAGSHFHNSTAPGTPTTPTMPPEKVQLFAGKNALEGIKAEIKALKAEYVTPGKLLSPSNKAN